MKKNLLLVAFLFLSMAVSAANKDEKSEKKISVAIGESEVAKTPEEEKPRLFIKGFIDIRFMYDSYRANSPRNVQSGYPLPPNIVNGVDLNDVSTLRASAAGTRLAVGVDNFSAFGAKGKAYVEADFMGTSDATVNMIRLRHSYLSLQWEKDMVLAGQTNSLLSIGDEVNPETVDYSAGQPYTPQNRSVQLQYRRDFTKNFRISAAALVYSAFDRRGSFAEASLQPAIPDLELKFSFGDKSSKGFVGGVALSSKFSRPRLVNESGEAVKETFASYVGNAFMKFYIKDYKIQISELIGGNLAPWIGWGGFTKSADTNSDGSYNYTDLVASSSWMDISSPMYGIWQFGLFGAYAKNLGTLDKINPTEKGAMKQATIQWTSRIAPRVWVKPTKHVALGIEYAYDMAKWAESINENYLAEVAYPTSKSNRIILLARYVF